MPRNPGKRQGREGEVMFVRLACGHVRRYFVRSIDNTYYCIECDEHKEVVETLNRVY